MGLPEGNVVPISTGTSSPRNCLKCQQEFTETSASGDPRYCQTCGRDYVVTDEYKIRSIEDYDEFKDILNKHTQKFRQVTLSGEFWQFNIRSIINLSDTELKAWIEYHKGMITLLEQDAASRHVKKTKQVQAEVHAHHTTHTTTRKVTETTVTKKTRVKSQPSAESMLGNLTEAQKAALLKALLGGK